MNDNPAKYDESMLTPFLGELVTISFGDRHCRRGTVEGISLRTQEIDFHSPEGGCNYSIKFWDIHHIEFADPGAKLKAALEERGRGHSEALANEVETVAKGTPGDAQDPITQARIDYLKRENNELEARVIDYKHQMTAFVEANIRLENEIRAKAARIAGQASQIIRMDKLLKV